MCFIQSAAVCAYIFMYVIPTYTQKCRYTLLNNQATSFEVLQRTNIHYQQIHGPVSFVKIFTRARGSYLFLIKQRKTKVF